MLDDESVGHFIPTKQDWSRASPGCDLLQPNPLVRDLKRKGDDESSVPDSWPSGAPCGTQRASGSRTLARASRDHDLIDVANALSAVSCRSIPDLGVDSFLVDTGCGHDLISKAIVQRFPEHILPRKVPLPINTAGGLAQSDSVFVHRVDAISDTSHATVMDSTPPVLTVGGRSHLGFSHLWVGGCLPIWVLPGGLEFLEFDIRRDIPYLDVRSHPKRFADLSNMQLAAYGLRRIDNRLVVEFAPDPNEAVPATDPEV